VCRCRRPTRSDAIKDGCQGNPISPFPLPPSNHPRESQMTEHRAPTTLIRLHPGTLTGTSRTPMASAGGADIEPLMTAAEVGHLLQIPRKRAYEVVGHLAVQIAPRTLRWRRGDILALIDARRRTR